MRQRGATVLEVVIALSVVIVLLTAALGGERAQQRAIAQAYSNLEASRAASSRIEVLASVDASLTTGSSAFAPAMEGAIGTQRVRLVEPGLYEIEVEVVHPDDDVRAVLTTRLAREVVP